MVAYIECSLGVVLEHARATRPIVHRRELADSGAPFPRPAVCANAGMEIDDDPTARVRERRFTVLVDDLLPKLRRLNPTMPDDQVLEMAESMAELRLLDEEIG